ncbi:hypothetical protein CWO91_12345 [Bradyrhizobium genosp. SA-3]|nr:hypothetical protein CWO91_12345 [Bradyrhizobium genosp. SA-3]
MRRWRGRWRGCEGGPCTLTARHCERSEAIQESLRGGSLDCFAEPVIGPRFARTRWLAMTVWRQARATHTSVVPAKAGTHNHRQEFGEDRLFGISTTGH